MNKTTKTLSLAVVMFSIAGMTGAFTTQQAYAGGEGGCSSGFWKNNAKNSSNDEWVNAVPGDDFETKLGEFIDPIRTKTGPGAPTPEDSPTMLEALNARGGGINALARELAAAYLNTQGSVSYDIDLTELKDLFASVDQSDAGQVETLRALLFALNHNVCPL